MALAAVLAASAPAAAENLIVDLSTDSVLVSSDFSGINIALFGVVQRDAQTVARGGHYEIAVVVRGPPDDVLVQRKDRRFGIWINAEGEHFPASPSFSALFTTESPGDQLAMLLSEADTSPGYPVLPRNPKRDTFFQAFANAKMRDGLYVRDYAGVEMLTDHFFRALIPLPGVAPDGLYAVDVFLFANGVVLDRYQTSFRVDKVGFEQQLFSTSRRQPLFYGLGVVVLALVTGYVGGIVFRRN
ncbi:MAG: TIGR02186 family protein [Acuticoccus sp.]